MKKLIALIVLISFLLMCCSPSGPRKERKPLRPLPTDTINLNL